ncbi:MAG: NAD(P)-dependent oxidoreductase [Spirochaetes bacterium]|nr:NAD(P)-dependent oxidoreductase [Spirochaetota bacterium]MBU0957152.1 NAD(P)-dependent oxidoreductase [Spirochaetota bacterium]
MARILVSGAFGNVGRSTVAALLAEGHSVLAFDRPTGVNQRLARSLIGQCKSGGGVASSGGNHGGNGSSTGLELRWGDIRDTRAVAAAVADCDAVVHLAAIIPPLADRVPELAAAVNVGGTRNIIAACEALSRPLIHASSIALYGDRVCDPFIQVDDPVHPAPDDVYGFQKAEAEGLVRNAGCPWTILRLSYVVSRRKLALDPLMFRMPLATSIEVVHTEDAGRAFAHAVEAEASRGKTYNIGGGAKCRTSYREYLLSMFTLFGLGRKNQLPEAAFARQGYHCGWLDSEKAELALHFQKKTLADYYVEVAEEARRLAVFVSLVPKLVFRSIMRRSPYLPVR